MHRFPLKPSHFALFFALGPLGVCLWRGEPENHPQLIFFHRTARGVWKQPGLVIAFFRQPSADWPAANQRLVYNRWLTAGWHLASQSQTARGGLNRRRGAGEAEPDWALTLHALISFLHGFFFIDKTRYTYINFKFNYCISWQSDILPPATPRTEQPLDHGKSHFWVWKACSAWK